MSAGGLLLAAAGPCVLVSMEQLLCEHSLASSGSAPGVAEGLSATLPSGQLCMAFPAFAARASPGPSSVTLRHFLLVK